MVIRLEVDLRDVVDGKDKSAAAVVCALQLSKQSRTPREFKIQCNKKVNYSVSFFKVILNYKLARIRFIPVLVLEGFNNQTTENLVLAMHDLGIFPDRLFHNGQELDIDGAAA